MLGWEADSSHVLTEAVSFLGCDYCPYAAELMPIKDGILDSSSNFSDGSTTDTPASHKLTGRLLAAALPLESWTMDECTGGLNTSALKGCSWTVLLGVQDPDLILELQGHCPRMLVIEPSSRRAAHLRESWDYTPQGLQIWPDPVGVLEQEVRWYSYNDSRLDGTQPPADFLSHFRNISVIAEEERLQRHLGDVVNEWLATQQVPRSGGALLLRSSDPESLIAGSTTLLANLQCLVLWTDSNGQPEGATIDDAMILRLEDACLRRSCDDPLLWERDGLLVLERQLAIAHAELERLADNQHTQDRLLEEREGERVELAAECRELREALTLTREEARDLHKRCHTVEGEHAELQACVAELERQSRDLILQREGLLAKAEAIAMEAEAARMRTAELEQECGRILAEHQVLLKAHDMMVHQRGALDDQVGQLRQENTALREQHGALKQQNCHISERIRELLSAQHNLQTERDSLILERQTTVTGRDQLKDENERLQAENIDLQRRLEESAKLTARTEQELAVIGDLFVQISTPHSPSKE